MTTPDNQAALDAFPDGANNQGQYVWEWFKKHGETIRAALTQESIKDWEKTVWEIYGMADGGGQTVAVAAIEIIQKNHPYHFEEEKKP